MESDTCFCPDPRTWLVQVEGAPVAPGQPRAVRRGSGPWHVLLHRYRSCGDGVTARSRIAVEDCQRPRAGSATGVHRYDVCVLHVRCFVDQPITSIYACLCVRACVWPATVWTRFDGRVHLCVCAFVDITNYNSVFPSVHMSMCVCVVVCVCVCVCVCVVVCGCVCGCVWLCVCIYIPRGYVCVRVCACTRTLTCPSTALHDSLPHSNDEGLAADTGFFTELAKLAVTVCARLDARCVCVCVCVCLCVLVCVYVFLCVLGSLCWLVLLSYITCLPQHTHVVTHEHESATAYTRRHSRTRVSHSYHAQVPPPPTTTTTLDRELLMGGVYEQFRTQPAALNVFLDTLLPLVREDELRSVPTPIVKVCSCPCVHVCISVYCAMCTCV